jgi:Insertion element 4 transposase N-terminal
VSESAVAVSLSDLIGLGLLTSTVPREVVDDVVEECGRQARRSGGSLPPHVVVYFVMALALFADDDYEAVFEHLAASLAVLNGWDGQWVSPTSGGLTQARARLGVEPVRRLFEQVAVPVATQETPGAFLAGYRMVSMDGMVFDVPACEANDEVFGCPSAGAFPQVRATTLTEVGSQCTLHAVLGPVVGKGTGERTAAWELASAVSADMVLLADAGFYSFGLWCDLDDDGAAMIWRIGDGMNLPKIADLPDGSYLSMVFAPGVTAPARRALVAAAEAGEELCEQAGHFRVVRVVEYYVADRGPASRCDKTLICVITNLVDPGEVPAALIAWGYGQRWEHEGANAQIKTGLRGPGRILRSHSPDMVRQEIYGYLLVHYALRALICQAATAVDIDPARIKFTATIKKIRQRITAGRDFSP